MSAEFLNHRDIIQIVLILRLDKDKLRNHGEKWSSEVEFTCEWPIMSRIGRTAGSGNEDENGTALTFN